MPRWYLGFHCRAKNRQVKADRFAEQVRQHKLGKYIPVMRVEKGQKSGEFYLFLAIESQAPSELPDAVQKVLPHLRTLGTPIPKTDSPILESFTLEEIRRMVGVEHTVHDYARLIPYVPCKPRMLSNPFTHQDLEIAEHDADVERKLLRSRRYDRLLLWLSAAGSGSWQTFQNVCHALGLEGRHDAPTQVLRRLRLLGHIETSPDRSHWSATPTTLVLPDARDDEHTLFLCGLRDNATLQVLRKIAHIEEIPQPTGEAPARVFIHASDRNLFLARIVRNHPMRWAWADRAALRLSQVLPSLTDWKHTLEVLPYFTPYQYQAKRFDGSRFVETDFDKRVNGFYQFWMRKQNTSASDQPACTLFYDAECERFLRGDWYGLRFLTLQTSGRACPVTYYPSSSRLAIPQHWRWPELYERVLVLASGKLPVVLDKHLVYESISPSILSELKTKLNLDCEEATESCMT